MTCSNSHSLDIAKPGLKPLASPGPVLLAAAPDCGLMGHLCGGEAQAQKKGQQQTSVVCVLAPQDFWKIGDLVTVCHPNSLPQPQPQPSRPSRLCSASQCTRRRVPLPGPLEGADTPSRPSRPRKPRRSERWLGRPEAAQQGKAELLPGLRVLTPVRRALTETEGHGPQAPSAVSGPPPINLCGAGSSPGALGQRRELRQGLGAGAGAPSQGVTEEAADLSQLPPSGPPPLLGPPGSLSLAERSPGKYRLASLPVEDRPLACDHQPEGRPRPSSAHPALCVGR